MGVFNRGFLEEVASEPSLKAVFACLPRENGIQQTSRMESGNWFFREVSQVI